MNGGPRGPSTVGPWFSYTWYFIALQKHRSCDYEKKKLALLQRVVVPNLKFKVARQFKSAW
jgi:hypothetical protein